MKEEEEVEFFFCRNRHRPVFLDRQSETNKKKQRAFPPSRTHRLYRSVRDRAVPWNTSSPMDRKPSRPCLELSMPPALGAMMPAAPPLPICLILNFAPAFFSRPLLGPFERTQGPVSTQRGAYGVGRTRRGAERERESKREREERARKNESFSSLALF